MTEHDIEARLRRVLTARADQVDSAMTGPELRARAAAPETRTRRPARIAAMVSAGAAVAVLAVATAPLDSGHPARPTPPGGHSGSVSPPVSTAISPSTSPSVPPPVAPSPSASSSATAVSPPKPSTAPTARTRTTVPGRPEVLTSPAATRTG